MPRTLKWIPRMEVNEFLIEGSHKMVLPPPPVTTMPVAGSRGENGGRETVIDWRGNVGNAIAFNGTYSSDVSFDRKEESRRKGEIYSDTL